MALTLAQLRLLPPLIDQLQKAIRERAAGTTNAADETNAIRNAANWEGQGGDAAMYALARSVDTFDRSSAKAEDLATAINADYDKSVQTVNEINSLQAEAAAANPKFGIDEQQNRVIPPDTTHMSDDARKAAIDKDAELIAKIAQILRDGEAADQAFGQVISTATAGVTLPDAVPLPQNGQTVVAGVNPPDGRPAGTGYWTIDKNKPLDSPVRPAGVPAPYSSPLDPNSKLNMAPSSNLGVVSQNWAEGNEEPFIVQKEKYRFRAVGTEFTGQTKMIQENGKWYEAEWQNYKYEAQVTTVTHMNGDIYTEFQDLPQVGQWTPVSMADIYRLSLRVPDTVLYLPDTCGNTIGVVNGAPQSAQFGPPGKSIVRGN